MPPALMNLLSKAYQEGSPNMATGTKPTSKWLLSRVMGLLESGQIEAAEILLHIREKE